MMFRKTLIGATAVTAFAVAPALAADDAVTMSPETREMHQEMGVLVDKTDRQAAADVQTRGDGVQEIIVDGKRMRVVTARHAWPELFAAQVDGIARVGGGAQRAPVNPQAPVSQPD